MKLRYEKYNNSDNVITINLHNGYTVIAITGLDIARNIYIATLFLKANDIDDWKLIEKAEKLEFNTNKNTINSAILKKVSMLLEEGFFDYYIQRYEYELKCFEIGNNQLEEERIGDK